MSKRQVTATTATGETLVFNEVRKKVNSFGRDFHLFFDDGLKWLTTQNLTGNDFRVFMWMAVHLRSDSFKRVLQKKVAEDIQISQPSIQRSFKKLLSVGLIEPREGKGGLAYRVNSDFVWKGPPPAWHAHQKRRRNEKLKEEQERASLGGDVVDNDGVIQSPKD